jgi:hypothetical protein
VIDDSDVDFFSGAALFTDNLGCAFVLLALVIVLAIVVVFNKEECAEKRCPPNHVGKLVEHECMCVIPPEK